MPSIRLAIQAAISATFLLSAGSASIAETMSAPTILSVQNGLKENKLAANKLSANKLSANKLSANKLSANKLAANRLSANKLAANKIALNATSLGGLQLVGTGPGDVTPLVTVQAVTLADGTVFAID